MRGRASGFLTPPYAIALGKFAASIAALSDYAPGTAWEAAQAVFSADPCRYHVQSRRRPGRLSRAARGSFKINDLRNAAPQQEIRPRNQIVLKTKSSW